MTLRDQLTWCTLLVTVWFTTICIFGCKQTSPHPKRITIVETLTNNGPVTIARIIRVDDKEYFVTDSGIIEHKPIDAQAEKE